MDNRVTIVSKHFTGKGHSANDMHFSIMQWCSQKYNTLRLAYKSKREEWLLCYIGVIHHTGIK